MQRPESYSQGCECPTCLPWARHLTALGITDGDYLLMSTSAQLAVEEGRVEPQKQQKSTRKKKKEVTPDKNVPYNCMICRAPVGLGDPNAARRYETLCSQCVGIGTPRVMEDDLATVEEQNAEFARETRRHRDRLLRNRPAYTFSPGADGACEYCLAPAAESCTCNERCPICVERVRNCRCTANDPFEDTPVYEAIVAPVSYSEISDAEIEEAEQLLEDLEDEE